MANRKLPFGYCMQNGQICVVDAEAEIVRMIFTSYAEGNSYETLAEWLNDGRHIYFPGKQWNKNTQLFLRLTHSRGGNRLPAGS